MQLGKSSKISIGAAFAVVVLVGSLAGLAFARDNATYNLAPQNTYIENIDISGLTAEEAKAEVENFLLSNGNTLTLHVVDSVSGVTQDITFDAGISYNVDEAIQTAIGYNHDTPALQRIINSTTGVAAERHDIMLEFDLDASNLYNNLVATAPAFHVEPADAWRDFNDDNTVTVHPEVIGRDLNVDTTYAAAKAVIDDAISNVESVAELLNTDFTVEALVVETKPYLTVDEMPPSITVDYSSYSVFVFDKDVCIYHCYMGYGCGYDPALNSTYDSPTGLHYCTEKVYEPIWYNPDPKGWGKDLPETLGPGVESLLGLRALAVSDAPMIFLHGVSDYGLIGRRGSHGCINIMNEDIINIYDLIPDLSTIKDEVWIYFHDYPGSYNPDTIYHTTTYWGNYNYDYYENYDYYNS